MKYEFKSKVEFRDTANMMAVPFNVWEVCEVVGKAPVRVCFDDICFTCNMESRGQGYYDIPISDDIINSVEPGKEYTVSLQIVGNNLDISDSPYWEANPIRRVDHVDLVTQPWDGLCGQAAVAMIAGVSLDEACDLMHCREWQANMAKMITTLDYLGIPHSSTLVYTLGSECELPKCAILMEKMGRYSHYLVTFDGKFYDPNTGITSEFDLGKLIGYLEIGAV